MSCSVHDAAELERRGIPTVTVCTEGFLNAGVEQAGLLGLPGLRLVSVPSPFASLTPEAARQRGAAAVNAIVVALTADD